MLRNFRGGQTHMTWGKFARPGGWSMTGRRVASCLIGGLLSLLLAVLAPAQPQQPPVPPLPQQPFPPKPMPQQPLPQFPQQPQQQQPQRPTMPERPTLTVQAAPTFTGAALLPGSRFI